MNTKRSPKEAIDQPKAKRMSAVSLSRLSIDVVLEVVHDMPLVADIPQQLFCRARPDGREPFRNYAAVSYHLTKLSQVEDTVVPVAHSL